MAELHCVAERITYQNEDNGFSVMKCRAKGYGELVTVIGNMPDIHVGSVLIIQGEWKTDAKYGRQFSVQNWEEALPASASGIEKYLSSGLIKGVGPKFAGRIVKKFGENTLEIIDTDPYQLLQVEGIGQKRVDQIKQSWQEQREIKNIIVFLQSHDVSTTHAAKIFKTYGNDSVKILEKNPYRLADDIWGIGFKTADTIAEKLGIKKNRFIRLRSGLLYTLNQFSGNGHCYVERGQLIDAAVKLLDVPSSDLKTALDEMLHTSDIIRDGGAIYLPAFYYSEVGCAKQLRQLMSAEKGTRIDTDAVLQAVISSSKIDYETVQLRAIRKAVTSKVMVLTGGPGTGKTTTTLGIISAYRQAGCEIILAAPTGRAAKRMSEATGMEAKTIHRLLEYKPPDGYQRNENNPLKADVLIVDECSMIDIMLMYNLLKALPNNMTLILVGDVDQLPSVGAGNVLKDIIASDSVPVIRLTKIFRQAQGSRIITNAHRINRGEFPDLSGGKDSDFFFSARDSNEAVAETLVQFCTQRLPNYYHADAFRDIQVLTPMQRGVCGAANLNLLLQEAMNPNRHFLSRGGIQYRLHDKVMQIKNDYEKDVFNGDIGIVTQLDLEERELMVDFDGRDVVYDVTELDELVLAYATTIHKAQGSEYPIVVMPLTMSHYVLLQRNLLYTGVTRAKRILLIIGEKKAIACAVKNDRAAERNTKLAERLLIPESHSGEKAVDSPIFITDDDTPDLPDHDDIFTRLARSEFRSRFSLRAYDIAYINERGMNVIRAHAEDFIRKRLAPAQPKNDGKQTPMRGHPVFLAQHATATCCRNCLAKWHKIPKGRKLTEAEQEYVVDIIMEWIRRQVNLQK